MRKKTNKKRNENHTRTSDTPKNHNRTQKVARNTQKNKHTRTKTKHDFVRKWKRLVILQHIRNRIEAKRTHNLQIITKANKAIILNKTEQRNQ